MKFCINCQLSFKPTKNQMYCTDSCRKDYRRRVRQPEYSIKYANKSATAFMSRLLNKRRYLKNGLSLVYLENLYNEQDGRCALSGTRMTYRHGEGPLETNISIDKIDPSLGYVEGNVQLVCRIVNIMKYTNSKEDLISWCNKIVGFND